MKIQVTERESEERLEHARSVQHKGQLTPATEDKAASIWSSALLQLPPEVLQLPPEVLQLPPEVLSFSLNVAQDT